LEDAGLIPACGFMKNKKIKYKRLKFLPSETMSVIFKKLNEENINLETATMEFSYDRGCPCCGTSDEVDKIEITGEINNG